MSPHQALPKELGDLIKMLSNHDAIARQRAAYALGRVSSEMVDVFVALGEALFDIDDEVCIAAGVSLFACGLRSAPATPSLIKAVRHRNTYVRRLAIATLSSIGPAAKCALPAIVEQTDSPDPYVRMWRSTAIKNIGSDSENPAEKGVG